MSCPATQDTPPKIVRTKRETAQKIRVSERTLDRLSKANVGLTLLRLSARRVGFDDDEVNAYLARLKDRPKQTA